ncbi:uncharacterized protein LOC109546246 [Dendroctonus ponderosae]
MSIMSLPCLFRKLLKKLKKSISNRRPISKWLLRLPRGLFPNYRVLVNSVIVESNRRTLHFISDDPLEVSEESFSSGNDFQLQTQDEMGRNCCKHCRQLCNPTGRLTNRPIRTLPILTNHSTPIRAWLENVDVADIPPPPPMPSSGDEIKNHTPLRRFTVSDIRSVQLRPTSTKLDLPKTPDVHDMMAVLRRRFAAIHSPMVDSVVRVSSDSEEDTFGFHWDVSRLS